MSAWRRAVGAGLAFIVLGIFPAAAHQDLSLLISNLTDQIRLEGPSAELLYRRAEVRRLHEEYPLALADYDAAARLTNSPAVDNGRAQTLAASGRLPEARAAFDRVLQHCPTNAPALLGRAQVLAQLNQPALAAADYAAAFDHLAAPRPDDYLERARLQALTAGPAAAVKGLDEGLNRLGWTLPMQRAAVDYDVACGHYDSALARVDTILTRASRRENWLELKAQILTKAGRKPEARAACAEALQAIAGLPPRLAGSSLMLSLRTRLEALKAALEQPEAAGAPAKPPADQ